MQAPSSDPPRQDVWLPAMRQLSLAMAQQGAHPSRTLLLLPYAQLIPQARRAWAEHAADGAAQACFVPRFETSMTWAARVAAPAGGFLPRDDDLRGDAGLDILTSASLLARAGLASRQHTLAAPLLESAQSLGRLAAAQRPAERTAWAGALGAELGAGMDTPALTFELALARIALAWAAASSYPSDALFTDAALGQVDLLAVLEGFQPEPLTDALRAQFGARCVCLALTAPSAPGGIAMHAANDAEDEAQRAAACVLTHLAVGRTPVALVAQDRLLTRRVRALLAGEGVALRDETGWKLSTTRAAAALMSLLRAMHSHAASDAVLDWIKNAPAFDSAAATQLEVMLRKAGVRQWRAVRRAQDGFNGASPSGQVAALDRLMTQIDGLRSGLQQPRSLPDWLSGLRAALQASGQWATLLADVAGSAVLEALRLDEAAANEDAATAGLAHSGAAGTQPSPWPDQAGTSMSFDEFTHWVRHTLEAGNFSPVHPALAQVVILPLSQLLGRPVQAVVLPGADEVRLPVSPEPPGVWTVAQRALLGLPSRAQLEASQRASWDYALRLPAIDVLWRSSEEGEPLMPSGFVQQWLLQHNPSLAADPRVQRAVAAAPIARPLPTGESLPVGRLSASAYEDLRSCPYRFFALRQLGLHEASELETALDKRDFGNWLHHLLQRFHETLKASDAGIPIDKIAMINAASEQARKELGLLDNEFLPFATIWPRLRDGYLEWLAEHEARGARFEQGEVSLEAPLGPVTLVGKLDRIDRLADGSRMVMDYKTEAAKKTKERLFAPLEDTQLAFYAALLPDDELAAAYVNLGETEPTKSYEQPDIVELRDQLIDSIRRDMARIARAVPLPALGAGRACDHCATRGLCRKDFWSE